MKRLTILLAALGALLLVSAAPASASGFSFTTFGQAEQPTFTSPAGMTVDPATGDLLVIDLGNQTLHRYKPNGEADDFSAVEGGTSNVIDGAGAPGEDKVTSGPEEILSSEAGDPGEVEVAVAPPGSAGGTAGDIYVTDALNGRIVIFGPTGAYLGQQSFGYPCGLAVDSQGNLFVGSYESEEAVYKLIPSEPATFTEGAASPYATASPCQVAAGEGHVYVGEWHGLIHKIASEGPEEGTSQPISTEPTVGVVALNVDSASGHLFVVTLARNENEILELDVSGAEATVVSTIPLVSKGQGVAVNGAASDTYITRAASSHVEVFGPAGPTNRRLLTIAKAAGGPGGVGTVSSKPKGIKCAAACDKAVASMYENSSVVLTEKPSSTSTFTKWEGGDCEGLVTPTCTVGMNQAEEVTAVFGGSSKPIAEPTALTVSKGESTGTGVAKASGLACEAECTETTVLYQGPITSPKAKPAKTVELSQIAAYGSEFSGWSGCDEVKEGKCIVTMSTAKSVTAEFTAKPAQTLTIEKNSYGTGTGTVSSKPKGIKCAATCTTQAMSVPQGEAVLLTEKPAAGMTFVEWEGGGCSTGPTCTVTMSSSKTVKAIFAGTPKAIAEAKELTLTKAGSGFGTVKASGLACEVACTSATSLYAGPVVLPKPKAAATVTLEGISAPGSKTVAWSGCDSVTEGKCVVTMETAKSVTATFDELE